ncbi:Bug family tripartite tricarboxylate transporter substrate binding protein [Verminephrobacter aporrectodeae]|uniref:Tripartite tricarboxylate transporter substrate binding protein n=1 Tax=Verminephrobacter aporrectodeae subsp. tuberculatae TaxID=1110392 RepID=A0ABT3KXM6_9BURK|nr:tripartite tricarboxylate transporter substrate binding protein [Verminephrobacter aporrectodeae]MCW5258188.1 tripartite tricarboxylate transporter substrate binding protein [Verminephrobacter aporrectodeae subsp. tuberculatae]MCW5322669.1 tripartite tricarboxylate transporter substrate binding protein [Verminephrobacter aporrectodeae subsp. tuberculatae]MCW8176973.1 tripartite tricarboxylate transporter substrate binding protein [Verminephrobacter aporrectodeae subsp. tuberculatae]MCW820254
MRKVFLFAAACLFATAPTVHAEPAYPTKPIRLIVPFAPGGSTDVLARLLAAALSPELGQPVIVENKAGAGGNIGGNYVAKSAPDGYTLLIAAAGPTVINPSLYARMPYDPAKDLRAVSLLIQEPNLMAVNPKIPAKTVPEFIAYAKSRPNEVSFGSPGNGSPAHLAGEWFKQLTGTTMAHIPYKGTGPALNDLLAGQIAMMIDNMPALWPHVQSGKLRALAVSTDKRTTTAPDVPTIAESVKGFSFGAWKGLMAPAATPPAIVERLHAATTKALETPELRKRLIALGAEPVGNTPAQFAAVIEAETASWAALLKLTGAKLD